MFNIFNTKRAEQEIAVAAMPRTPVKGSEEVNAVVEEIHKAFYTEIERLLEDAHIQPAPVTTKIADKAAQLKKLGFVQCKDTQKGEDEIRAAHWLRLDNEKKSKLINAVNYFSKKYPTYKLITEEAVKQICDRYNLVYGPVGRYKGSVPDKNLQEIANFKVKEEDKSYTITSSWGDIRSDINMKELKDLLKIYNDDSRIVGKEAPLEIAAPVSDFDTTGMRVRDLKLAAPDPVVLHPVLFEDTKYYFVVTAWGPEASDPEVVNPKNN